MGRATPIILSFNGGELTPLLDSRVDLAGYAAGCRQLRNWIPMRQGAATRRPGTRYIKPVKDETSRTWLARFVFDEDDAYILEFGNLYIRFFTQGGQVESAPSVPLEVVTEWATADLENEDAAFALQLAQSGDVIWIVGGGRNPKKLSRVSALVWTLDDFSPDDGPFLEKNPADTTVYASAVTGTGVTLTASAGVFLSGHVGGLFRLWDQNPSLIKAWKASESVTADTTERRSDGKYYLAKTTATTGPDKPVHEEGTGTDGTVTWEYLHSGMGVVRVTAVNSPTVAVADVIAQLPAATIVSGTASTKWEFGAWSDNAGWPKTVAFYRERLVFGRNRYRWFSAVDDFSSFADQTANQVLATNAITIRVNGDRINVGKWMIDAERLVDGTNGGEFNIGKITDGDVFGPQNVEAQPTTKYGSRAVRPVFAHDRVLFTDRTGQVVREVFYKFDGQSDSYVAVDLTRMADHIARAEIIDMAWQSSPLDILWCVLKDGSFVALTYDPNEQVTAWHSHALGGGLYAESVETMPRSDAGGDEVWLIVRKDASTRWVLKMDYPWTAGDERDDAFFVDAGLTYSGAPTTVVTGLDHLEGKTVAVLADGAVPFSPAERPTVVSGSIEIPIAASTVHVGQPYTSTLEPMLVEAGAPEGTAQGRRKHIHEVFLRVLETRGLLVGPSEDRLSAVDKRSPWTPMGAAEPLYTGLIRVNPWDGDYEPDNRIIAQTDEPLPATILSISPRVTTHD